MIKIDKPKTPPAILTTSGVKKRRLHCDSYSKNKADYVTGKKRFVFDSAIYGHRTVKEALKKCQKGKCCFCESKIDHIAHGDVEHFRPKAGYKQKPKDKLTTPGYYWLAYEWENLFFSCQLCNQRYKHNLFPLKIPQKRAKSHHEKISKENPLFINPAEIDPKEHISFRKEIPYPLNGSLDGIATIDGLGLDRETLNERRREKYNQLEIIYQLSFLDPNSHQDLRDLIQKAKDQINNAQKPESEYSLMVQTAIKNNFALHDD